MYNDKHNLANGEDNNDGENHNNSWNCGQVIFNRYLRVFSLIIFHFICPFYKKESY